MRARRLVPAVLAAAALCAPSASASGAPLTIPDPAHDANGVPGHDTTAPASVDSGDLRAVTVSTVATPEGRPTALRVRFDLTADPLAGPPLAYGLHASLDGCDSGLFGAPQAAPHDGRVVRWYQHGDGCPAQSSIPGFGTFQSDPRWTVTTGPTSVELQIPFDSLTTAQAAVLAPGTLVSRPAGAVTGYYAVRGWLVDVHGAPVPVDETAVGPDWTVGSDLH